MQESEEQDTFDDVRLLFDQNEPKVLKTFDFSDTISIQVLSAEDKEPGALQSGIFLWPASYALCEFLCGEFDENWCSVVEFGAGCGLVGLTAAKLLQNRKIKGKVIFTDRDWVSLKIIKSSVKANKFLKDIITIEQKILKWTLGKPEAQEEIVFQSADLALGSDLMYSTESALALISTVFRVMPKNRTWRFILSSSFRHIETTNLVEKECEKIGMKRRVLHESYQNCLIEEYTTNC